jgi:hypothetical protein
MGKVKTTVYLEATAYRELKRVADEEGKPAADLIRRAVSEYVERSAPTALPASLGAFASGDGALSERVEELLDGFGGS